MFEIGVITTPQGRIVKNGINSKLFVDVIIGHQKVCQQLCNVLVADQCDYFFDTFKFKCIVSKIGLTHRLQSDTDKWRPLLVDKI